ncbi:cathepsin B-like [Culex quinquefasciatus]|uniref:cathepsin B-like n=1 Tax=Culex quinquefasciatus TaxID=7176 RepID=UPI0018E34E83|nr:cathepsin B-like [Culex quinquefasciatus]
MALTKVLLVLCLAVACISAFSITNQMQDALVSTIESRTRTWVAQAYVQREKFGVMSLGLRPNDSVANAVPMLKNQRSVRFLPESFDSRQKWSYCPSLNQIRDQGCCGSCYIVATAAAITDRYCIHSRGQRQFTFGATDYLACCTDCFKCDGGYSAKTWQYWVDSGLTSEGAYKSGQGCYSYPFNSYCVNDPYPTCNRQCQAGYPLTHSQDLKYGASAYRVMWNERAIMTEIYQNGPVVVQFEVFDDFYQYKSGVYRHVTGTTRGWHVVRVIGWGVENGVKYWLIANSWGARWGDKGFVKFVRGENHLEIENFVYAGLPKY